MLCNMENDEHFAGLREQITSIYSSLNALKSNDWRSENIFEEYSETAQLLLRAF
jgi:hypothetical protein